MELQAKEMAGNGDDNEENDGYAFEVNNKIKDEQMNAMRDI